jgi:very-short-patch-repair endonuclease
MRDWERRVNQVLWRQGHVITVDQCRECGASRGSIDAKVRSGAWVRAAAGVYRPAEADGGWEQSLWVAHLVAGPESIVSHEAAAELHGLRKVFRNLVTVTVPTGADPRAPGARFTASLAVPAAHRGVIRGLPVTTPARTITDLAGRSTVSAARLEAIVSAAHRDRTVSVGDITAVAAEVRRPGRRGVRKLDGVLAQWAPGKPIPESKLEEQLSVALDRGGLAGQAVGQYPLPGFDLVGLADAAIPEAKMILEADGRRWHELVVDMVRDRARDNQAATQGWLTLRFMYGELFGDLDATATTIRVTYDHRA